MPRAAPARKAGRRPWMSTARGVALRRPRAMPPLQTLQVQPAPPHEQLQHTRFPITRAVGLSECSIVLLHATRVLRADRGNTKLAGAHWVATPDAGWRLAASAATSCPDLVCASQAQAQRVRSLLQRRQRLLRPRPRPSPSAPPSSRARRSRSASARSTRSRCARRGSAAASHPNPKPRVHKAAHASTSRPETCTVCLYPCSGRFERPRACLTCSDTPRLDVRHAARCDIHGAAQNMVLLHLRELERGGGATLDLHGAPVAGRPQAELLAWYLEQQAARRAPTAAVDMKLVPLQHIQ